MGQRIRDARRRAHLTQAELARRVGIRTGPMNSIEQGRNLVSTPVLAAVASELGSSVDELLFGHSRPAPPAPDVAPAVREGRAAYGAQWEALAGMTVIPPSPLLGRAELSRRLDAVAAAFLALEDICGVMKSALLPLSIPFDPLSDHGVGDLVASVRSVLGIGQGVIFDHLELLENAGLRIVFLDLPADLESIGAYDDANANVMFFLRAGMNPERQTFRLLYELGRVYDHVRASRSAASPALVREDAAVYRDRMARQFAALFLMPEAAVRTTVRQLGLKPDEWTYPLLLRIKHRFGVSAQAFNLRLLELGLIAPRLQADLRAQIEKHYAETDFGEPDSTRRVLSPNGRLGDLLLCARERHHTTEVDRLAAILSGLTGLPAEGDSAGMKKGKRRGRGGGG